MLKGLPFAKMVYAHFAIFEVVVQLSIFVLFWFKQFEGNSSEDLTILQLPLGDVVRKP
jgi:hypothetical protein